jgi:glyoxylase-like metal-dependent hydrolase (beta-lactamase superfamily II)
MSPPTAARDLTLGSPLTDTVPTFTIGSFECRVVPDGVATYEKETWYSDLPAEELEPSVRALLDDQGLVRVPYHPLLVRGADGLALIDAGTGPALAEEWGEPIGRLREALSAADTEPEDIRLVLLSHAHPDHVGGLTFEHGGGRHPMFPNARHVISRTEFEYWTSDRMSHDFAGMGGLARLNLTTLERAGILDLLDGEQEVASGIRVIPAPGHTPGHVAVSISEGSETAIFVADAVLGELNFEHADWSSRLEVDRAEAVRTRRRLLDEAARYATTVVGYHLWGPGVVGRRGAAYRWDPLQLGPP